MLCLVFFGKVLTVAMWLVQDVAKKAKKAKAARDRELAQLFASSIKQPKVCGCAWQHACGTMGLGVITWDVVVFVAFSLSCRFRREKTRRTTCAPFSNRACV